jgi:divalent metal cation (Fe/Co/Zn/Cd) transporter
VVEDGKKVAALYSTLLNVVFVFLKSSLAVLSGTAAIMVEAVHSFKEIANRIISVAVLSRMTVSVKKKKQF